MLESQSFIPSGDEVLISTQLGQPQCLYDHWCVPATAPLLNVDSQLPEVHLSLYLQHITPQSISVTSDFPYPLALLPRHCPSMPSFLGSASFFYGRTLAPDVPISWCFLLWSSVGLATVILQARWDVISSSGMASMVLGCHFLFPCLVIFPL